MLNSRAIGAGGPDVPPILKPSLPRSSVSRCYHLYISRWIPRSSLNDVEKNRFFKKDTDPVPWDETNSRYAGCSIHPV